MRVQRRWYPFKTQATFCRITQFLFATKGGLSFPALNESRRRKVRLKACDNDTSLNFFSKRLRGRPSLSRSTRRFPSRVGRIILTSESARRLRLLRFSRESKTSEVR